MTPGCGCPLCRRPLPDPPTMDVITATMKQDAYEETRRQWREMVPLAESRSPSEAVRTAGETR